MKKSVAPKKAEKKAEKKPAASKIWTLPVAMLMLAVAAAGLWFAMRESANRTEAATPAAAAVMAPEGDRKAPASVPKSGAPASPTAATPSAATSAAASVKSETTVALKPVSITGCLQRNDRGFLLKDTEGAFAPKSRSWKSGFLKRSSSSVALTDTSNAAHLADHVGQRVSVTGPLTEREMNVMSLRRVAASCQ